jgi:hypothetical protein
MHTNYPTTRDVIRHSRRLEKSVYCGREVMTATLAARLTDSVYLLGCWYSDKSYQEERCGAQVD